MTFNFTYLLSFLGLAGTSGLWSYVTINGRKDDLSPLPFASVFEMERYDDGPCVNFLLEDKDFLSNSPYLESATGNQRTKFIGKDEEPGSQDGKGCASVQWVKKTWKDGYGTGKIAFEGFFKHKDNAIIARGFSSDSDVGGSKQLKKYMHLDGRFAFIKEKKVDRFMQSRTSMIGDKYLEQLFPNKFKNKDKDGYKSQEDQQFGDYWNFNFDSEKICRMDQRDKCSGDPEYSKEFSGKWKGEQSLKGNDKFSDGSSNFSSGGKHLNLPHYYNFYVQGLFDTTGEGKHLN